MGDSTASLRALLPIPPHLTFRQMGSFAKAAMRHPESASILRNAARQIFGSKN